MTLLSELGWLSVRDFGAVGGQNERGKFQAFFDALAPGQVGVIPPPLQGDRYIWGGAGCVITKPCHIVSWCPSPMAALSRIEYTGTGAHLTITADHVRVTGVDLFGLNANVGIDAAGNYLELERVNLTGYRYACVQSEGFSQHYRYCLIQGSAAGGGTGIRAVNFADSTLESLLFVWGASHSNTGLDVQNGDGSTLLGCRFDGIPAGSVGVRFRAGADAMTMIGARCELAGGMAIQQDDNALGLAIVGGSFCGAQSIPSAKMISLAGRGADLRAITLGECAEGVVFEPTAARCTLGRRELKGTVGAPYAVRAGATNINVET